MFQEIAPYIYNNEYKPRKPQDEDYIFIMKDRKVMLEDTGGRKHLPFYRIVKIRFPVAAEDLIYLFSIDSMAFFLSRHEAEAEEHFQYHDTYSFREEKPAWYAFAGATASQLGRWYLDNQYCGRCASAMVHSQTERAVCCPACGMTVYPKISPAVIVGVIDGENILLTRYSKRTYKRYALIAGFVEIGETFEDTVKREVMEEAGLKVKNIRYYKSQPWAFSDSVLSGFFADLDGSNAVTLDENELSEAVWVPRDAIPADDSQLSLTWEMIMSFYNGRV